jgi:hypothetical protein
VVKNSHSSQHAVVQCVANVGFWRFMGRLRDGTGKLVARYDIWDDRTRDRTGRVAEDLAAALHNRGAGASATLSTAVAVLGGRAE